MLKGANHRFRDPRREAGASYCLNARSASSLLPQMSKILCIRTSSNTAPTGFDMPHSFSSPPVAFNCLRHIE